MVKYINITTLTRKYSKIICSRLWEWFYFPIVRKCCLGKLFFFFFAVAVGLIGIHILIFGVFMAQAKCTHTHAHGFLIISLKIRSPFALLEFSTL